MYRYLIRLAFVSIALLAHVAQAQETSATIRGEVTGPGGTGISNAKVTVTHVPSGTTQTVNADSNGAFFMRGLRVGGPYEAVVSSENYQAERVEGVFLRLGETYRLDVPLDAVSGAMDEIVVTAQSVSDALRTGPSSTFSADDVDALPSISRDPKDIARLNPLAVIDNQFEDQFSIAGANTRFNSFTVDGIRLNDDFGLNANGFPTRRSPLSIEVIDQLVLNIAPYDAKSSGYTGGNLNIVTKSGTNEYHGAVYYYYSDDDFSGDPEQGSITEFEDETYGFTVSGPIIKDKLFFFVNYENFENLEPSDFGPAGSGRANEIASVAQADVDEIISIAQSVYGYDPGTIGASLPEGDEKIFLKLDWNINDSHRASFTYQFNDGNQAVTQNLFGSNFGLTSNWYDRAEELNAGSLQLFSDWTDQLSTEFKISYKNVETTQASLGGTDFAEFEVVTSDGGLAIFGPDEFRHANMLENENLQIFAEAEYLLGDHLLTAGYEYSTTDIFNLFVATSNGVYRFNSIDDLRNRIASSFRYNNAFTANATDGAANWSFATNSFYLQDEWRVSSELDVVFGLRYERYSTDDKPASNGRFFNDYGFGNDATLDGLDLLLPRIGFSYTPSDLDFFTLRGGIGRFSGGSPNVWVSNNYTNDGVTITSFDPSSLPAEVYLQNVDGFNIPAAVDASLRQGNGGVDAQDPAFEIPSVWKLSFGADIDLDLGPLGKDYAFFVEYLHTISRDAPAWRALDLREFGFAPDGRPRFAGSSNDFLLTNAQETHGDVFTLGLNKSFAFGPTEYDMKLDTYIAYAHQDIESVFDGQSSRAISNWDRAAVANFNDPEPATSGFQIEDRIVMSLNFNAKFFGDLETNITLFGEWRDGLPFSYTYNDPIALGDPRFFRDRALLYVPTGFDDPLVVFDGINEADFNAFLASSGLDAYRGQIAPRNAFQSPDVTRFDLRFAQEVPGFMKGHRAVLVLDIENIGNMLNDDWGKLEQVNFPYAEPVVNVGINDNGQYVYSNADASAGEPVLATIQSLWKIQLGIRYEF